MITASPSDWSTPARSDWIIRERIAYECVAGMFRATPPPILLGLLFAAACAAVLLHSAPPLLVAGWYGSLVLMTALRLWQTQRFLADPQRRARAAHWERAYGLLMLPYGLAWGGLLLLAGPGTDGFTSSVVIVGLLGVASVGVYALHGVFHVAALWMGSIAVPVAAWCLWRADLDGTILAFGTALFGTVMLNEARRSSRLQTELLRLRLHNTALTDDHARALALAERSQGAKTRFLATVSHEMRTPLNGIVGISELLRDGSVDPQVRRQADCLLRSAEQLHRFIGDMLDLSELESGHLDLQPAPFDPAQALHDTATLAAPEAAGRGLVLALAIDPAVPRRVSGDVARVKQVLHNLVSNALRVTVAGRIELRLAPSPQGLRYSISDTGPGVAPERLGTLFDPFDDAGPEADRRQRGVGLELAIARRLARAMNGDLVCEPSPGRGCRFCFTVQAPVVVTRPLAPSVDDSDPPRFSGRVLVVDDNEVNALVAQAMLLRLGLASDIAKDGEQALAQMARRQYDLVLMDCRMPVLDGWEATRRWRRREGLNGTRRPLPILGATANVSDADRRHCLECGMTGYLPKPFRVRELAEALRPHLSLEAAQAGRQSAG